MELLLAMNWFRSMPRRNRNNVARSLKRRRASLNPKPGFILFCEGRNTEPDYFRAVRNSSTGVAVDIKVAGGVPMTLANAAVKAIDQLERRKNPLRDQVWTVFDRDEHPQFDDAVALCRQHDIGVARSDPCFELWLILHLQDFDGPRTCRDVQRELEALHPAYDRNHGKIPDCDTLVRDVERAEQRAEAQLERREREANPLGNPSTTVGRLTLKIREAGG